MTRGSIAGLTFVGFLAVGAVAAGWSTLDRVADPAPAPAADMTPRAPTPTIEEPSSPFLYGRVATDDGEIYEGRLRWGGDEEALWSHYFNGSKDRNPWADRTPGERRSIRAFGLEISWNRETDLGRPFMARFGDIRRIEPRGRRLLVTLKSGSVFDLDRYAADDLADGLRIWDARRGVVDLDEWSIESVELLPGPGLGTGSDPLHGTVRTRRGEFTGLVQWDREAALAEDELDGRTDGGDVSLRFDGIRSIVRRSPGSSLVTLADGREVVLSGTRDAGEGNRGVYVDDARYGRVLVSWDAFERVDFTPGGAAPAWGDFPPGGPLTGTVVTRSGRRLAGRLVYDLDESETTETLDAPADGVDYTIPFSLVASIEPAGPRDRRARVTLGSGEELRLERAGDLGDGNAGLLVVLDGRERPEYVPWDDVERIDFARPPGS